MSSELVTDIQFTDQAFRTGVNAKKLNLAFTHATIQPAFVSDKPAVGAYASGDYLLLLKADGTYAKIPPSAVSTGGGTGSGDMLKAVYDTNNNGTVDTADSLAWSRLTSVPASFAPSAHASTHLSAGSDPIALASATLAGLCPAVDNTTIQVVTSKLSCVALAWTAITGKPATFPPDSTAMLKSVYDTNADNIVDHAALADTAPWTGITGKPSTFPPDSTAMLKSVYDTNADSIVDHAALADTTPWTGITGKPASFAPSAHAPSHLDNGADPIPVATTSRTGLVPILNGNSGTFLNGTGTFSAPAGGGDMLRSVYDTNANNVVDTCDSLAWSKLTGVPTGNMVDPGTWTALSYSTGWSEGTTARYRVETNGTFQKVICEGIIAYASGAASLAFTLPSGARPAVQRGCSLAGYDSSGDVQLFQAVIGTGGAVNIYPMVRQNFVWPSATNGSVYLDSLSFSL